VSEAYLAKGRNKYVAEGPGQLHPALHVEAVEGEHTDQQERQEQEQAEDAVDGVLELLVVDDLGHFGRETHDPDEREDQGDPVELVVDQLVVLVHLEDERVVYVVLAEHLNGHACCVQDETQDRREVEHVDA